MSQVLEKSYYDYLIIISRVFSDKCFYTLFKHFDLFDKVERLYPDKTYYSWWTLLDDPSFIIDNLYLGSAFNAADQKVLTKYGIKVVVNATKSISNFFPDDFTYYNYPADDLESGSLSEHYQSFYQTMLAHRDQPILIHCYAGRSRSAALVLSYLTRHYQMSIDDGLKLLSQQRPIVNINREFINEIQLIS